MVTMYVRPFYVAALGVAVMCLWGWYLIPGAMLIGLAVAYS